MTTTNTIAPTTPITPDYLTSNGFIAIYVPAEIYRYTGKRELYLWQVGDCWQYGPARLRKPIRTVEELQAVLEERNRRNENQGS